MQKCIARHTAGDYVGSENDDDNDYVGDSLLNDDEKTMERSNFSEAMTTHFNLEMMDNFLEKIRNSDSKGSNKEKATGGLVISPKQWLLT